SASIRAPKSEGTNAGATTVPGAVAARRSPTGSVTDTMCWGCARSAPPGCEARPRSSISGSAGPGSDGHAESRRHRRLGRLLGLLAGLRPGAKEGTRSVRGIPMRAATALAVVLLFRVFRGGGLAVDSIALAVAGAVIFFGGIGIAVWARVHLGRNWGMPTTQ